MGTSIENPPTYAGIVRTFPRVMVYTSEKTTRTGSESSLVQSTTKKITNFNWVNCK